MVGVNRANCPIRLLLRNYRHVGHDESQFTTVLEFAVFQPGSVELCTVEFNVADVEAIGSVVFGDDFQWGIADLDRGLLLQRAAQFITAGADDGVEAQ